MVYVMIGVAVAVALLLAYWGLSWNRDYYLPEPTPKEWALLACMIVAVI